MSKTAIRTLVLVLILLLATGLRLYRLDAQSFWNDEGNSARAAERPIPVILDTAEGDIHPPGYYLLLHFWRALVGESEFALRALSAFCGVLAVVFTFCLGRRLLSVTAGLGAAVLAAFSPLAVYYSQEARMYALLGLVSVASTYFLSSMLEVRGLKSRARGMRAAFVLTTAAGLYTHYAFPFVVIVHNLVFLAWWLGQKENRWRLLTGWAAIQAMTLLLYLPWLPVALKSVTGWSSAGRGYELGPALLDVFRVLVVGITQELDAARGVMVAAGVFLVLGMWPRKKRGIAVLVTWLLVPIVLIFAFDLYKPAYLKFLLAVLPPFHLLLASGVENVAFLTRRIIRNTQYVLRIVCYVLITILLLSSLHHLYYDPLYARDDYRQITADIEAISRPGDGIILNAANQWEVFTYYHREGAPVYPIPRSRPPRADQVIAEMEEIGANHRRLFALYWGDTESDPEKLVERWLALHAYPAGDRWVSNVRVAVYGLGPQPQEPEISLDALFGEAIHLQGYAIGEGPFEPGEVILTTLFWETSAAIPERYKVFVHLLDSDGNLVAQIDAEPLGNLMPTTIWSPGEVVIDRHGVFLPTDLPAGEYQLVAGLYDLFTGERLPVGLGETIADHLSLGMVAVSP